MAAVLNGKNPAMSKVNTPKEKDGVNAIYPVSLLPRNETPCQEKFSHLLHRTPSRRLPLLPSGGTTAHHKLDAHHNPVCEAGQGREREREGKAECKGGAAGTLKAADGTPTP